MEALQRIEVRYTAHIHLVTLSFLICLDLFSSIAPTQAGERFDKVAQECSEDKAKGTSTCSVYGLSYSNNPFL